jgi:hypothetical protein
VALVDEDGAPVASSLEELGQRFELSEFERGLVVMCLAMETDARFAALCARAHGNAEMSYPTFSLGMRVFGSADWSVCSPHGALRRWSILEVGEGKGRVFQPLSLSERVLDFLLVNPGPDRRLLGTFNFLTDAPLPGLITEQEAAVGEVMARLVEQSASSVPWVTQLCGPEALAAAAACVRMRCQLAVTSLDQLPRDPAPLLRLWEREAILSQSVLLIEGDWTGAGPSGHAPTLDQVLDPLRCPVLVSGRVAAPIQTRFSVTVPIPRRGSDAELSGWASSASLFGSAAQGLAPALKFGPR